jgi:hypothetical protein
MSDKVIKLSRRYEAHGAAFDEVHIRQPKLRDLLAIGDPIEAQPNNDGGRMLVEYQDRIEAYASRLIQKPGYETVQDLDLADAMRIKDAILDFFSDARKSLAAPTS